MDKSVEKFYEYFDEIVKDTMIDLSTMIIGDPWVIGEVCLLLIERQALSDKKIILPTDSSTLNYLKRIRFKSFLLELGYTEANQSFDAVSVSEEKDINALEITHCRYVDEFSARLGRFERMFKDFGLNDEDSKRALVIVGELGNNVFDHNVGSWPTNFSGGIIVAQNYPDKRRIEVVVADAGVGFLGSLKNAYPDLKDDIEAIRKGLKGYTGRIGENRGNGLKLVQSWTIKNFHGILYIRSGGGLIHVDEDGEQDKQVPKLLGTLAQFVIYYR
jgi:hypothetical protein